MKTVTFYAEAIINTYFDVEVTDEQYRLLKSGEDAEDVIEDFNSIMDSALYDEDGDADVSEEYEMEEDEMEEDEMEED